MALRHAVLAALLDEELSGYQLAKVFAAGVANFWHAKPQQVYAELAKLEKDGLAAGRRVAQEGRPDKRLFCVTAAGLAELERFASAPSAPSFLREDLLVQVQAADHLDTDVLIDRLTERYARAEAKAALFEARLRAMRGSSTRRSSCCAGRAWARTSPVAGAGTSNAPTATGAGRWRRCSGHGGRPAPGPDRPRHPGSARGARAASQGVRDFPENILQNYFGKVFRLFYAAVMDSEAGRRTLDPVEDGAAFKALTHPLRLTLLGLLRQHGPATASELAARTGSPRPPPATTCACSPSTRSSPRPTTATAANAAGSPCTP